MKKIALFSSLIGLLLLSSILLFQKPVEIDKASDLDLLEQNTLVSITDKVIREKILFSNTQLLILESNIEVICECAPSFKDKNIKIIGKVEKFNNKKQIRVLKIEH